MVVVNIKKISQSEDKVEASQNKVLVEIVDKVCKIVKKKLALPEDSIVTAESKFAALGVDSLIYMIEVMAALEEEFGIIFEEGSAKSIATVYNAAFLIEKLIKKEAPNSEDMDNIHQQQQQNEASTSEEKANNDQPIGFQTRDWQF